MFNSSTSIQNWCFSASKDEETAGLNDMPPEETKGISVYSPNAVKIALKDVQ